MVNSARCGRQESVDGRSPDRAGLLDGQSMLLAHAPPTLVVGDRLERNQQVLAFPLRKRRKLGPKHDLEAIDGALPGEAYPRVQIGIFVSAGDEYAPHRGGPLARPRPCFDMGANPDLAIAVDIARRSQRCGLCKAVVGGGHTQLAEFREALEDRADGVAGALGDLRRRRHLHYRVLANEGQVGLDDKLLGAFAAQAAAIDPDRPQRPRRSRRSLVGSLVSRSFCHRKPSL